MKALDTIATAAIWGLAIVGWIAFWYVVAAAIAYVLTLR